MSFTKVEWVFLFMIIVDDLKEDAPKADAVKVLCEEDLDKYSIYDIVLPLPGFDVTYPDNKVKDWYREILQESGLELEMPKQKVRLVCVIY